VKKRIPHVETSPLKGKSATGELERKGDRWKRAEKNVSSKKKK